MLDSGGRGHFSPFIFPAGPGRAQVRADRQFLVEQRTTGRAALVGIHAALRRLRSAHRLGGPEAAQAVATLANSEFGAYQGDAENAGVEAGGFHARLRRVVSVSAADPGAGLAEVVQVTSSTFFSNFDI